MILRTIENTGTLPTDEATYRFLNLCFYIITESNCCKITESYVMCAQKVYTLDINGPILKLIFISDSLGKFIMRPPLYRLTTICTAKHPIGCFAVHTYAFTYIKLHKILLSIISSYTHITLSNSIFLYLTQGCKSSIYAHLQLLSLVDLSLFQHRYTSAIQYNTPGYQLFFWLACTIDRTLAKHKAMLDVCKLGFHKEIFIWYNRF